MANLQSLLASAKAERERARQELQRLDGVVRLLSGHNSHQASPKVDSPNSRRSKTAATHQMKPSPQALYWESMTSQQRSNEMKRRMSKWSKDAKRRWKNKGA
jgi:hypothetical protein